MTALEPLVLRAPQPELPRVRRGLRRLIRVTFSPWGGLIVDLFCGGGGFTLGVKMGLKREVDEAVNHDDDAIAMHQANHPDTRHHRDDVWNIDPHNDIQSGPIDCLLASAPCTHFSRAKGAATKNDKIRALPWVVIRFAETRRPRVIILENVPEWVSWGPLHDGKPIKESKGETFRQFVFRLETCGYKVEWRNVVACDYGAPTKRKRLFLIARRDGEPIVWPEPTHGTKKGQKPFRTAAECIDFGAPMPSIFTRKKPLRPKTQARIAEGIRRFVVAEPRHVLGDAAFFGVTRSYGERKGQKPRVINIHEPLGTVVAGGAKHALACAWVVKHYKGVFGHLADRPLGTVTTKDHHSLGLAFLTKFYNTSTGQSLAEPAPTVTAKGNHLGLVDARATTKTGSQNDPWWVEIGVKRVARLMRRNGHAVSYRDDGSPYFPVAIDGEEYVLFDVGMRMLTPRELARAMGFPDSFLLTGTKTSQIARIGNAVSPPVAAALVRANIPPLRGRRRRRKPSASPSAQRKAA